MNEYVIIYNNVQIPVDPEIFSTKSETFKEYYNPAKTMTITGERSVERFKQLLPYVQGQEPDITIDNIDDIESFADEWDVQSLKDSIEDWKKLHAVDVKLEEFLENARARISVSSLIPGMVDSINELLNKPKFLNVPPKLLHQILSSATKQERIKDHHVLYNFIMNFVNQDQQNRLILLNFINPNYLSQNEVEQFFESNLLPKDPSLLSQIPVFLTNLALLFREKYKNEQVKISSIEADIQKQDATLERKNKEYQIVKDQLSELQQQQRQLSKKPKKNKYKNQMVYVPDSDPDKQPSNNSQKQDNRFSYTPSNNSDSTASSSTNSSSQSSSYNNNNNQYRGGGRGGGRGGKGSQHSPARQTSQPSNSIVGGSVSNEVPAAYKMQMPMQMPMAMPMNMQMQIPMNVPLMTDSQIKELEGIQSQYQQQMQQLVQLTPLSKAQLDEINNLTQKCQQIQAQLDQQKQKKKMMESNHSISIQKNTKNSQISMKVPYQSQPQSSPLGAPLNLNHTNPVPSMNANAPLQVEKLVPSISVEKPKIKRTTLDPEQKAMIAAAKKHASVKVERPVKGASIEFEKTNED